MMVIEIAFILLKHVDIRKGRNWKKLPPAKSARKAAIRTERTVV